MGLKKRTIRLMNLYLRVNFEAGRSRHGTEDKNYEVDDFVS